MENPSPELLKKWRLILGQAADPEQAAPLETELEEIDAAVSALYDSDRKGGLGSSHPHVNRWLGDIRRYFPTPVVQIMQQDALDRLGLHQMLTEPELLESLSPNVELVATILQLKELIPDKTKATARQVVQGVVDELEKKLRFKMEQALNGALRSQHRTYRPKFSDINWAQTIHRNLKHYQTDIKALIPELLVGYGRRKRSAKRIVILTDQSASMADSVVYASIMSAILASIQSIQTQFVVFDTKVVNLTEHLQDPVDLLFGLQLGGGTDILKALQYGQTLIQHPKDTILILISDLFEGGRVRPLIQEIQKIKASGVTMVSLLALNDEGSPQYDREVAQKIAQHGVPVFATTPDQLTGLFVAAVSGRNVDEWIKEQGIKTKR